MSSIPVSFIEFLIYIVPGLIVTFALRHELSFLGELFEKLKGGGIEAGVALTMISLISVAMGLFVAAIAWILTPFLGRMGIDLIRWIVRLINRMNSSGNLLHEPEQIPHFKELDFCRLYDHSPEMIQRFREYQLEFRMFSNAATAALLVLLILLWTYFIDHQYVDRLGFKLLLNGALFVLVLISSVRKHKVARKFASDLMKDSLTRRPLLPSTVEPQRPP